MEKQKNETISIIVPVYNVENYLKRCVESLLAQTFQPIQIILIDDGSTDQSAQICDSYNDRFSNITVIHKENEGQAEARNIGLSIASGEWIAFIDSDDWIEPTFCEELYRAAKEHDAPISMCKTRLINDEGKYLSDIEDTGLCTTYTYDEIIHGLVTQERIRFELWNKLWKKELIQDCSFIKGQISEEVHFDRIVFPRADKFVFIDRTLHNYMVKRPGNTNSSYKKKRDCIFEEFDAWNQELSLEKRQESANVIQLIAMKFAIIMYYDAFIHREKRSERLRLKHIFNKYYCNPHITSDKESANRLFYRFPNIYCILLTVKKNLRNRGL